MTCGVKREGDEGEGEREGGREKEREREREYRETEGKIGKNTRG